MAVPLCAALNDEMPFRPLLRARARINNDRGKVRDDERRTSNDQRFRQPFQMIGRRFDLPGFAEEHRPHHRRYRRSGRFDERDRLATRPRTTRYRAPTHNLDFVAVIPEAEQLSMALMKIRDEIADVGSGGELAGAQRNFKLPDLAGITAFHAEIDTAFARRAACFVEERLALRGKVREDGVGVIAIERRRRHEEVRLNSVDISERTAPAALSTAPTPGN